MPDENALSVSNDSDENNDESFDFDSVEEQLQIQLDAELADLDFLESEKEKIGNPDALGKVVLDEVWKQFSNQVGLDMTNETLIQKYDREHPEQYDEVAANVMKDQRYKDANKEMKDQQSAGTLKDEYTGKTIKPGEQANLDHTVSRKEIFESQRRKQANKSTEELANKKENLNPTNESLNKSKGAKTVDEYTKTRAEREKELIKQNERANKKIDESNMSEAEKKAQKAKNNKRLQDKLDADDKLMKEADKKARDAINHDIRVGAVKEVGKKAGKDALKTMAVTALSSLLKEVVNGLVRFFKSKAKSFKNFLGEIKNAIKSFFTKITSVLKSGASSLVGTIVSEIFGPIVSMFKKLASFIKQGISSFIEAIKYLTDKKNKSKPFSIKIAQVGKIITAGIVAGGAIFLGEVFEKFLLTIPGMQIQIPLFGSLANIIGLFLASLVSGIIGAIIMNLIDKFIAKRQKAELTIQQIDKGNKVLSTQQQMIQLKEAKLGNTKLRVASSIADRHAELAECMKDSLDSIFENNDKYDNTEKFGEIDALLNEL